MALIEQKYRQMAARRHQIKYTQLCVPVIERALSLLGVVINAVFDEKKLARRK